MRVLFAVATPDGLITGLGKRKNLTTMPTDYGYEVRLMLTSSLSNSEYLERREKSFGINLQIR